MEQGVDLTLLNIDKDQARQPFVSCKIKFPHKVHLQGLYRKYDKSPEADGKQPSSGTRVPDFVKLSEAMGCYAIRCESPDELDKVIEEANSINDRPVVVDFIVHEDAMVWPMVAAGTSNDEVMFARDVRPDFGDNEDD